jgi:hypothetical protein
MKNTKEICRLYSFPEREHPLPTRNLSATRELTCHALKSAQTGKGMETIPMRTGNKNNKNKKKRSLGCLNSTSHDAKSELPESKKIPVQLS